MKYWRISYLIFSIIPLCGENYCVRTQAGNFQKISGALIQVTSFSTGINWAKPFGGNLIVGAPKYLNKTLVLNIVYKGKATHIRVSENLACRILVIPLHAQITENELVKLIDDLDHGRLDLFDLYEKLGVAASVHHKILFKEGVHRFLASNNFVLTIKTNIEGEIIDYSIMGRREKNEPPCHPDSN
jgi:hypothetical protein